jgi:acetyl esterase
MASALFLRAERALATSLGRLPPGLARALSGGARPPVDGRTLDPHVQLLLALERLVGAPPVHRVSVARARRDLDEQAGVVDVLAPSSVGRRELRIDGPAGSIVARLYRPEGLAPLAPALVYFHGGGWVVGSLASHDPVCAFVAHEARCAVIAVDYRLAPEHRFPAALDDAWAAWAWVVREASRLGVDPARVAVGGDSAGGNLAAGVCHLARDRDERGPVFQMLVYPALDLTRSMASHRTFADGYLLTRDALDWYLEQYAPDPATHRDPRASPIFAERFDALPPALVLTAGFDPLRDEGAAYAERLATAGVPVEHRCEAGLVHGFWSMGGAIPAAAVAVRRAAGRLRDALTSPR